MSELLGKMAESLIAGNIDEVVNLTQKALDAAQMGVGHAGALAEPVP